MIGPVLRLVFFSLFHICDILVYICLFLRLSSSALFTYLLPALIIVLVSSLASTLHALYDAKHHRSLLPTLPGGAVAWLPAAVLCAIPPVSSAFSLIFFLIRAVIGSVGRDFRSSLVVVSEDAADAQFCLHAYLQSAPLIALNLLWMASENRVSAPLLLATLSSLLHVYAGIFLGRDTNVQLYFAWFLVDYDAAGTSPDQAPKTSTKLRHVAALISVCFRFWCVSVVATTLVAAALYAAHHHPALVVVALLASPHLFFLCFEVVWKLFAHRLLAFLQNARRRRVLLTLLILLCLATTGVNALFSAAWFVDVKRALLDFPSTRYCPQNHGSGRFIGDGTSYFDVAASVAEGRGNDYIAGIPSFIWPHTADILESFTVCVSRPRWSRCDENSLFRNGTLVAGRDWWRRVDWWTDGPAMWRSDALFCLDSVVEPLFLCLFYANACQVLILLLVLLFFATWRVMVVTLGGGGRGGDEGVKAGTDGYGEMETSFG